MTFEMPVPFQENGTFLQAGKKFPQYLATILASLSAFSVGTYLSWTSPALPLYNKHGTIAINDREGSWIGSLVPLGALIGAIPAGVLADKIGRKKTILIVTIPLLLNWIIIGFTRSILWLYLGRFSAGIAAGAASVAIPMYISEIAECSIRGSLGTFFQLQLATGILFSYITGMTGDLHYIALLCSLIPGFLLITFPFMPESPVWLISQGRRDEAKSAIQHLRGKHYQIQNELAELMKHNQESQEEKAGLADLKHHKKALIIALGLMTFQQLSGVNVVIFYAEKIFTAAGSTLSSTVSSVIIGLVQVLASYCSTLLVDRTGRKILLLISSSVMSLCLFVLAGYFHFQTSHDLSSLSWLPLLSLTIFTIVFSLGLGPLPWMMIGELFPSNVKGIASSVSAACCWSLAFTVTKVFQNMTTTLGSAMSFVIFALVCASGSVFIATIVPETKKKTLEQIQIELYGIREQPRKQMITRT